MKMYVVGGAVRDVLLGLNPHDVDYVVVGSSPEEMVKEGFTQVGADFPVFLDQIGQEFALARTERKSSAGYHGFEVNADSSVTLEQDLLRRDLTINAMAVDNDVWGEFVKTRNPALVIDPYNGVVDLKNKTLKHVSEAFAEDPLRVLRVARFRGRYGFAIHADTISLMARLVEQGEIATLTPERVWVEFEKGLMGEFPYSFVETLELVGAMSVLIPEYNSLDAFYPLSDAGLLQLDLMNRFVALFRSVDPQHLDAVFDRMKAPNDVRAMLKKIAVIEHYLNNKRTPEAILAVLEQTGVFKKSLDLLKIVTMYKLFLTSNLCDEMKLMELLEAALNTTKITFSTLPEDLQQTLEGRAISQEITSRRLALIRETGNFNYVKDEDSE